MAQIDLGDLVPLAEVAMDGPMVGGDGDPTEESHRNQDRRARDDEADHGGPAPASEGQTDGPPVALDLEVSPVWRRHCDQRSHPLMAHARATKTNKQLQEKNKALESSLQECQQTLKVAASMLPSVAKLLGHENAQQLSEKRSLTQDHFVCDAVLLCWRPYKGAGADATRLCIQVSYNHMRDETESRHKRPRDQGKMYRDNNTGVLVQTIVQRGRVLVLLFYGSAARSALYDESWLALPKQVEGTSTECPLPAATEAKPRHFLTKTDQLAIAMQSTTCVIVTPLGDKASGDVKIMKYWAKLVKTATRSNIGSNVLF